MKRNTVLTALTITCGGGLVGFYAWDYWPHAADIRVFGPSLMPEIMAAGKDVTSTSPPSAQPTPQAVATPATPPLHSKAGEFTRLTAAGATPAMLSRAFELAADCRRQADALVVGVETSLQAAQRCGLEPGQPDAATMRRMLEARVQRNDFGAWIDVQRERTGAFADERERWRQLVAEAYRNGKEQAEPTVMVAEFQSEYERANALRAAGQATEAQAAYRQAAVYAVASAIGTAQENGKANPDVFTDRSVQLAMGAIPSDQRAAIVNEGRAVAAKWRKS